MNPHDQHMFYHQPPEELLQALLRELRRPATIVRGYSELLLREGSLNEDQKEIVVLLTKMSTYMTTVLQQAILIRDLEEGLLTPEPTFVNVSELFASTLSRIQSAYPHKRHDIHIICEAEIAFSYIDKDQLRIVLAQIIENAIKYTPNDQEITITCVHHSSTIEINIKDHGIGIPSEYHHLLFKNPISIPRQHFDEPFGMGLGLFIVGRLLHQNNATIVLQESTIDGSSFSIFLPTAPL